jgi:hypothetical protein
MEESESFTQRQKFFNSAIGIGLIVISGVLLYKAYKLYSK